MRIYNPLCMLLLFTGLSHHTFGEAPSLTAPVPSHDRERDWVRGIDLASFLDCTRSAKASLVQAHRAGNRPGYAENALSTINVSLADGAVFIEIDIAKLGDGTLVLMHDLSVDRTTNGSGDLASYDLAGFRSLKLVDGNGTVLDESPPTLVEALDLLNGRGIAQLDLKEVTIEELVAAIRAHEAVERSLVITYSLKDAIRVHRLLPRVIVSTPIQSTQDIETLRSEDFDLTRLHAWLGVGQGDPELDRALADLGIETSIGNFPAESNGTADYRAMSESGAEVISVNNVRLATREINAIEQISKVLSAYRIQYRD